ncbi:hypothetical protein ACTUVN_003182 [Pseudomonas caspiana]
MALISHDQGVDGKYITTLHNSCYAPEYMRTAKDGKSLGGAARKCVLNRVNSKFSSCRTYRPFLTGALSHIKQWTL